VVLVFRDLQIVLFIDGFVTAYLVPSNFSHKSITSLLRPTVRAAPVLSACMCRTGPVH
jgi:hypothetical protein